MFGGFPFIPARVHAEFSIFSILTPSLRPSFSPSLFLPPFFLLPYMRGPISHLHPPLIFCSLPLASSFSPFLNSPLYSSPRPAYNGSSSSCGGGIVPPRLVFQHVRPYSSFSTGARRAPLSLLSSLFSLGSPLGLPLSFLLARSSSIYLHRFYGLSPLGIEPLLAAVALLSLSLSLATEGASGGCGWVGSRLGWASAQ